MLKLVLWLASKLGSRSKMVVATKLLHDVLDSEDYAIQDRDAVGIIETVVKSSGNKVIDFIIADR